ncbi:MULTISPECIES: GNAT family N-acetyltransferase [unclassified Solwaraspora]|uniref:GNAT family N-acetyltransferase n=1 Tax=unclassified Solwaraspora TaxID=2627926 RepID=UPI00259BD686|nr:GNAT family N-acetyltransferase [Solwaraspora sp. WMMA2056]WJK40742.1 GNAT family N-acetyltransferase [Solwaraspora sp. WMMA2056]
MNDQNIGPYEIRTATPQHLEGARSVMLDTFYHVFGYGYQPQWHADVIDLAGTYLRPERHALFVAVKGDEVVATTAVRAAAPNSPPHPRWLVDRYPATSTAQLFRVYVRPEHRRNGLARALVRRAVAFATERPGYQTVYLHTDTRVPGAEGFWRSVADVVHDPRDGSPHASQVVHFEIPICHRSLPQTG